MAWYSCMGLNALNVQITAPMGEECEQCMDNVHGTRRTCERVWLRSVLFYFKTNNVLCNMLHEGVPTAVWIPPLKEITTPQFATKPAFRSMKGFFLCTEGLYWGQAFFNPPAV